MEGSDDEFSDLELDEDDADLDQAPPNSPLTPSVVLPLPLPPPLSPLPQPSPQSSPQSSPPTSPSEPAVWTTILKPVEVKSFNSPVGPTTAIPETPREVFEIFLTDELMTLMVTESNRYAEDVMGSEKFAKWTKITVEEMKAFLGFSILMDINQLPAIKDYWKKNEYLHYSPIVDQIPRDRFLEISRYIHFVDNSTLQPRGSPGHDWLGKVRPIIDHLSTKFAEAYDPVAVDEAMTKFQGRSSLKPVKHGIKVWVLGDSETGYFSKFDVYCGKGTSPEKGLGARVVKTLTEPLKGKFHHVYFDDFFTSTELLMDLEKDGVYTCGTARKDRRGFPEELKRVNLKER